MRLLIVGGLQGQIGLATKIAMDKGAKVTHAANIHQALATLRGGAGAERSRKGKRNCCSQRPQDGKTHRVLRGWNRNNHRF